jgi:hypothetical protein
MLKCPFSYSEYKRIFNRVYNFQFFSTRRATKFVFALTLPRIAVNCWRQILSGVSSNKVLWCVYEESARARERSMVRSWNP